MRKLATGILALSVLISCEQPAPVLEFSVKNPLNSDRFSETISINPEKFASLTATSGMEKLLITDKASGDTLVTQLVDNDVDGTPDELLFQLNLKGGEARQLLARIAESDPVGKTEGERTTFSRFVPERTDDYAWENDRVAFRTYGPDAQRRIEENVPGGTLSSGMDAWLKRVEYPIIDKWYKNNEEKEGAYHIDTGEGYDPYHVGPSRGVGGTGIWVNDSLYTSKNFTAYKTIATGPLRTVFELEYAAWNADSIQVKETKRISLDLGSNLSRFESVFESGEALPNITIGLMLHEKEGEVRSEKGKGWFRYWEPMDGSELGVGMIIAPESVLDYKDHRVDYKDGSQLLIMADPKDNKVVYYAGFGWKKSGQFTNAGEWDAYLEHFAEKIANPVKVQF
ncbi:DUF4861 domain-containing protein [Sinomicrobium weinanense]|nr:DUF4861 domain-containing protein [Sinomicrobium weinanense]MBU3121905.1 DUF4861 domain-containing protein [Sinomicrobium weinanense]